ncbi:MAG TPA: hypothetical protein VMZ28_04505, partial [Kofleriaceae bacterium]|nr:hypothetical protein [Kofleriaceae bacterium]
MITAALLAGSFAALVTRDPLVGLGVMLLIFAWRTLNDPSGPPILALAFTYQWLQVMCALIYVGLTGRRLADMVGCDYAPMVLVALGALTALNLGLALGIWVLRKRSERELAGEGTTEFRRSLFIVYLLVTLFGGALREWAWMIPGVTQALIGLLAARLAVLFLMFRRLARPPARRELFILLLAVETVLGFSGFFAVFSEAFMMAALAVFEHFDRRRPEQWIAGGAIVVVFVCVGIVWTGVKPDYRRAWRDPTFSEGSTAVRLEKMESLVGAWAVRGTDAMWEDVDKFASRAWGIYYQALALRRVPAMIPHEKGRLFAKAIAHVTNPRFLNPEKDEIRSDSESVRRYAGVWVAGTK